MVCEQSHISSTLHAHYYMCRVSLHLSICIFDCFSFCFYEAECCHGNYDVFERKYDFYPSFSKKKKRGPFAVSGLWFLSSCEWFCLSAASGWATLRTTMLFPHIFGIDVFLQEIWNDHLFSWESISLNGMSYSDYPLTIIAPLKQYFKFIGLLTCFYYILM